MKYFPDRTQIMTDNPQIRTYSACLITCGPAELHNSATRTQYDRGGLIWFHQASFRPALAISNRSCGAICCQISNSAGIWFTLGKLENSYVKLWMLIDWQQPTLFFISTGIQLQTSTLFWIILTELLLLNKVTHTVCFPRCLISKEKPQRLNTHTYTDIHTCSCEVQPLENDWIWNLITACEHQHMLSQANDLLY